MKCPTCTPWYATTQKQFEVRLANMRASPQVQAHTCPSCGNQDWATSVEMIEPPKKKWWHLEPPSLKAVRLLSFCAAGFCAGLILGDVTLGRSLTWSSVMLGFLCGFNLAAALHIRFTIRSHMREERLEEIVKKALRLNHELMEGRVEMYIESMGDDDIPPTAPKLH